MTYYEFRDANMGKYLDWDGQYGPQCWDLAQCYVTECLELPATILSGCGVAKNLMYPDKIYAILEYFDEVPTNAMEPGDLCVWDFGGDSAGHVAIFDSWQGMCYYFSQNPGPSHLEVIDGGTMKAFRKKQPPQPQPITPTVPRDEYKDQIEVIVPELNVRTSPSLEGNKIGYAPMGIYNYYEVLDNDGYTWYKIADLEWIAYNPEWENVYPKKVDEYKQLKILDKKDGYVLVDLGQVWIKE